MAKNPIKLMPSISGEIIAGRVNHKTSMFVDEREDVTQTALQAVASHLHIEKLDYYFTIKGKKYILKVEEVE